MTENLGEIEENLGTDPGIALLHAIQEPVIDCQYLNILSRNHVGSTHMITNQCHLAKHLPSFQRTNAFGLGGWIDNHICRAGEEQA